MALLRTTRRSRTSRREGTERVRLHQHRYLGADRRALGFRERDVRLASGHLRFARDERAVSARRGGRSGREAEPRVRATTLKGARAGRGQRAGSAGGPTQGRQAGE